MPQVPNFNQVPTNATDDGRIIPVVDTLNGSNQPDAGAQVAVEQNAIDQAAVSPGRAPAIAQNQPVSVASLAQPGAEAALVTLGELTWFNRYLPTIQRLSVFVHEFLFQVEIMNNI